jgi:undecaprenyl-diphosphatase
MLTFIILGIVQGITEFLPISSSAHLIFFQTIFGKTENMLFFDVLVHCATLLAVVIVFYNEIIEYLKNFKIIFYIIIATIPTGIIGVIIKKYFEHIFETPVYASVFLIITGLLLYFSEQKYLRNQNEKKKILEIGYLKSLIVGIFQGIAVLPGVSRSGATLSSTMFLGIEKKDAVKFVFIMSIPAILGALVLETKDLFFNKEVIKFDVNYIYGVVFAFIFGILALKWLVKTVQESKLKYFAYYCILIGFITRIFLK